MTDDQQTRGNWRAWLRLGVLALVIAAAVLLAWRLGYFGLKGQQLRSAVTRIRARAWAGPIFVGTYAAAAAFGIPPTLLTLLGAAVFGLGRGLLYNWIGLVIGAIGGYWLARAIGGGAVRHLLEGHDEMLSQLKEHHGFLAVLRMQVIPVIPFVVANYAAGSAQVPFLSFLAATALGVVPATAAYTYMAQQVVEGVSGAKQHALITAAVIATVTVLASYAPTAVRKLRRSREA